MSLSSFKTNCVMRIMSWDLYISYQKSGSISARSRIRRIGGGDEVIGEFGVRVLDECKIVES